MPEFRSTPATALFEPTAERDRFLLEGPRSIIVEDRSAIAWVNIQTAADAHSGSIHVRFWDGEHRTYVQPRRPGFIFPTDRPNVLFVGMEKSVGMLDLTSNVFSELASIPDTNPRTIINDGEIVPGGRAVVFGTKDVQFADKIAHLYLYTLDDRRISILADGHLCSNGKVIQRDATGLTLFDIDTPRRNVIHYRLDLGNRTLRHDAVAFDLADQPGFPDGMCDGGEGTAIVAFYNPDAIRTGRAVRFDLETGEAMEEWTTPDSPRVTCPLLVERSGRIQLVLTTAVEGMPADLRSRCPMAGCLFIADTTQKKLPTEQIIKVS